VLCDNECKLYDRCLGLIEFIADLNRIFMDKNCYYYLTEFVVETNAVIYVL